MTTYTDILNTQIDVDSPVTTGLMTLLRDNPIAITEGATGAPKIQTDAIQDLAVTEPKLADSSVTQAKLNPDVQTPKAWIRSVTSTIIDSFNVASITYDLLGDRLTVNLSNNMANADYALVCSGNSGGTQTRGSFRTVSSFEVFEIGGSSEINAVIFGDQ